MRYIHNVGSSFLENLVTVSIDNWKPQLAKSGFTLLDHCWWFKVGGKAFFEKKAQVFSILFPHPLIIFSLLSIFFLLCDTIWTPGTGLYSWLPVTSKKTGRNEVQAMWATCGLDVWDLISPLAKQWKKRNQHSQKIQKKKLKNNKKQQFCRSNYQTTQHILGKRPFKLAWTSICHKIDSDIGYDHAYNVSHLLGNWFLLYWI